MPSKIASLTKFRTWNKFKKYCSDAASHSVYISWTSIAFWQSWHLKPCLAKTVNLQYFSKNCIPSCSMEWNICLMISRTLVLLHLKKVVSKRSIFRVECLLWFDLRLFILESYPSDLVSWMVKDSARHHFSS